MYIHIYVYVYIYIYIYTYISLVHSLSHSLSHSLTHSLPLSLSLFQHVQLFVIGGAWGGGLGVCVRGESPFPPPIQRACPG